MATSLVMDLTEHGVTQGDLIKFLGNVVLAVNELVDDVVTNKTTIDECRTAIIELIDDHATTKTAVDETKTAVDELMTDHATMIAFATDDAIINATALSVGSTAENIASTAFQYKIDGVTYAKAAVAAGTAFTAADTINTGAAGGSFWGVWAVQINAAGTISTKSPGADQTYADEATAIAALPAADAGNVVIGYATVQSNAGATWTAQTDDLTPASDCVDSNFYNTASDVAATLTATSPTAGPATLSAGDPTASAAAFTNTTDLTLSAG